MAAESLAVSVVPLNGSNYPTWKIQCRMTLMREGVWGIVNGTETLPEGEVTAETRARFKAKLDKALANI